jgi:hypothetical protein
MDTPVPAPTPAPSPTYVNRRTGKLFYLEGFTYTWNPETGDNEHMYWLVGNGPRRYVWQHELDKNYTKGAIR